MSKRISGDLKQNVERKQGKRKKALFFMGAFLILCLVMWGIVCLGEKSQCDKALKYAKLPLTDKFQVASYTYQDGKLHVAIDSETDEKFETIYVWLEYEEDGQFALVKKKSLRRREKGYCIGGNNFLYVEKKPKEIGKWSCGFAYEHKGERRVYYLSDFYSENLNTYYSPLEAGRYRMNYVLQSLETGEKELFQVPFLLNNE